MLKELTIDDWVLCNGEPRQVMQITSVSLTLYGGFGGSASVHLLIKGEVEPMPLTREFLEVNGWGYNDLLQAYENSDSSVRIRIEERDIYQDHVFDDYYTIYACKYVHEFQHLLRLVGLDEPKVIVGTDERCCGNCRLAQAEDILGKSYCNPKGVTHCSLWCKKHKLKK